MILPTNGRILIVDDYENQAMPLIKALSKAKLPFTYHSEKIKELPEKPYDDIRVLFLDYNLSAATDNKTIRSLLNAVLPRLISPNTPYILAAWSTKQKELQEVVADVFSKELNSLAPLTYVYLDKIDFFNYDPETGYSINEQIDFITELNLRFVSAFSSIDSIEPLIIWENIVNDSSAEIIKEIVLMASKSGDLNENLKVIYYKLAEAMWGRQLKGNSDAEIVLKTISIFNNLLVDKLDLGIIQKVRLNLIKNVVEPGSFSLGDKAFFNSKLLLSFDGIKEVLPGNVYLSKAEEIEKYPFNSLIADSLNIIRSTYDFFNAQNGRPPKDHDESYAFKNSKKREYEQHEKALREQIKMDSIFISLEVSPICDYAQKKWKSHRLCPGILWPSKYVQYINKGDNLYISPIIKFEDRTVVMVFDLRYFTSHNFELLKGKDPIFRLKQSLLIDIQSYLSRHINRPGVTSLN